MSMLYVIKSGRTTWQEQGRVESAMGEPLSQQGQAEVEAVGKQLAGQGIVAVYACSSESEQQTARVVAKALGAKSRLEEDLRELDYGLWQGLTTEEVKRRQPKAYRQWLESPTSVRPPGGESLEEVQLRLRQRLREIVRRHRQESVAVVLRPTAVGVTLCLLENGSLEGIWNRASAEHMWYSFQIDKLSL